MKHILQLVNYYNKTVTSHNQRDVSVSAKHLLQKNLVQFFRFLLR